MRNLGYKSGWAYVAAMLNEFMQISDPARYLEIDRGESEIIAVPPVVALPMLALGFRPSEDDVTCEFLY